MGKVSLVSDNTLGQMLAPPSGTAALCFLSNTLKVRRRRQEACQHTVERAASLEMCRALWIINGVRLLHWSAGLEMKI